MTPDLSYYWEGEREQYEDNKWDGKNKQIKVKNTRATGISMNQFLESGTISFAKAGRDRALQMSLQVRRCEKVGVHLDPRMHE